jgi:hypothetical protein
MSQAARYASSWLSPSIPASFGPASECPGHVGETALSSKTQAVGDLEQEAEEKENEGERLLIC